MRSFRDIYWIGKRSEFLDKIFPLYFTQHPSYLFWHQQKKTLLEYICNETSKVNGLKIESTKDAESIIGLKGYQYTVSGEVEERMAVKSLVPALLRVIQKNLKTKASH